MIVGEVPTWHISWYLGHSLARLLYAYFLQAKILFKLQIDISSQTLTASKRFNVESYLKQIKRFEYIQSFKRASQEAEQIEMAEMGLEELLKRVEQLWGSAIFGTQILIQ